MNSKVELIKAVVNKPIKIEIKDNLSLVSKYYVYAVDTDSCVITKEYVSEYIKPADRDSNFKTIKYDNINGIRIMAFNDIDYDDIYDNIDDYEYPYNHVNRREI